MLQYTGERAYASATVFGLCETTECRALNGFSDTSAAELLTPDYRYDIVWTHTDFGGGCCA